MTGARPARNPIPHNVERSGFHRGEYVGYGSGLVWRIRRREGGGWNAFANGSHGFRFGDTLAAIGAKLGA